MLNTALILEANRLLREGELSQRQIAARLDVSRGTISAVAKGRRSLYGRDTDHGKSPVDVRPLARCPSCGYRVYLPCLICLVRGHRARQKNFPSFVGKPATSSVESGLERKRLRINCAYAPNSSERPLNKSA